MTDNTTTTPLSVLDAVESISETNEAGVYIVVITATIDGDQITGPYGLRPETVGPLADQIRQWMTDNAGHFTIEPYVPPPPAAYQIAKTTPWLRMTDDEAELISGAMQQASSRQKGIYDAATYLASDDPLWSTLHDMIATTLNSSARADELLAPET